MLRELLLAAAVAAFPLLTLAQEAAEPAPLAAEAASAPAPQMKPRDSMYAFTSMTVKYLRSMPSDCLHTNESSDSLPERMMVLVVQKKTCTYRYSTTGQAYYEILYGGRHLLVPEYALEVDEFTQKQMAAMTQEEIDASMKAWERHSMEMRHRQLGDAVKALDATKKHGIAILDVGIFDVSEHTEGTGFNIEFINTTKKTIKYIIFNVVGLNAVGDPVRNRITGATTASFRGIGPIGPDENASYKRDYLWHTDLVDSFRLTSVKLEFMDGSSKVVTDIKAVRLKGSVVATINSPNIKDD